VHPGIELRLTVGNTAQVAAAVEGTVELGLVEGAVTDPALLSDVVARDQLVLVVSADHPWAGRARAELAELADIEWVLREPGSGTRSVFEAELARAGMMFTLRVALELPSNEAVRAAVEAGAGTTVISASVVQIAVRFIRRHDQQEPFGMGSEVRPAQVEGAFSRRGFCQCDHAAQAAVACAI
jgi:DNA-binding transcriptional LysR family regulator